jgi:hypothetical protein
MSEPDILCDCGGTFYTPTLVREIVEQAQQAAYAEGRKDECEARDSQEPLLLLRRAEKALADLSFECFGGIGTQRPSVETYNRTFDELQAIRAALAKASA